MHRRSLLAAPALLAGRRCHLEPARTGAARAPILQRLERRGDLVAQGAEPVGRGLALLGHLHRGLFRDLRGAGRGARLERP